MVIIWLIKLTLTTITAFNHSHFVSDSDLKQSNISDIIHKGTKRKRPNEFTENTSGILNKIKQCAMTILGALLPVETRWAYMQDWHHGPGWSFINSPWSHHLHQPTSQVKTNKVVQIPIQFVKSDNSTYYSNYWDECSDLECDDCDDCDMNFNSCNGNSRKRRCTSNGRNTPPNLRSSSKTSKYADVIEIDDENPKKTESSKPALGCTSSGTSGKLTRNSLHGSQNEGDKAEYIVCDSDGEHEINETNNYSVYEYLKVFLDSTGRQIDCIRGDGNCFFRALSKVIYGSQSFYNDIRQAVVDVLEIHPKKFEAFTDGPMSEHIKKMREDKTWATQTEIYAAATLLNRDIYILSPDQTGDRYRWLLFKPQFRYNYSVGGCKCYITLCHTHGNHYDRIASSKSKCNCGLRPPVMSGVKGSVDLTNDDEIV